MILNILKEISAINPLYSGSAEISGLKNNKNLPIQNSVKLI